jgi:murein DD-endopeptidase MepM/ murein hydrolase activator NlpD
MDNKTFTFIVTTNRKGETRNLTVSAGWLKACLAMAIVGGVLLAAAGVDYFGLLLQEGESKRLRAENAQLEKQFKSIESKLTSLESSLDRIKTLTTKIRLITNIEDEDRTMRLSMGPVPRVEEEMAGFEAGMEGHGHQTGHQTGYQNMARQPASSEFLAVDDVFMERPPLQEARGELAALREKNFGALSVRIDRAVRESELREQGVIKLQELMVERQSIFNATPNIKPARGWFTSRFGYRIDPFTGRPEMHWGLDIAASPGTPVMAPADGVVSYVGYESGYGKIVAIDHGYGVKTRFAHNSQIYVSTGQKIKRRDVISAVGSTGRSSGPHLHYEVRVNEMAVNPMNYILDE